MQPHQGIPRSTCKHSKKYCSLPGGHHDARPKLCNVGSATEMSNWSRDTGRSGISSGPRMSSALPSLAPEVAVEAAVDESADPDEPVTEEAVGEVAEAVKIPGELVAAAWLTELVSWAMTCLKMALAEKGLDIDIQDHTLPGKLICGCSLVWKLPALRVAEEVLGSCFQQRNLEVLKTEEAAQDNNMVTQTSDSSMNQTTH